MKVYITKYALSQGIFEMDVERQSEDGKLVCGKSWNQSYHGQGVEWCKTKAEAIARAEEMRQKKKLLLKSRLRSWRK